jgi:hypothetical protein
MKSNIVDVAGGTFVVTAISYATGIAYYNAFFRSINGKPDIFSVSLERVLFEGGRQLLHIAFNPILYLVIATLCIALLRTILRRSGVSWLDRVIEAVKNSTLGATVSAFSWAYVFLIVCFITSYSFESGRAAGSAYGESSSCVDSKVITEAGITNGCLLYKSDSEVWLGVKEQGKSVLLNIPNDKYLSIKVL